MQQYKILCGVTARIVLVLTPLGISCPVNSQEFRHESLDVASNPSIYPQLRSKNTYDIAFSPNGTLIAAAGDGISIWDVKTNRKIRTLTGSNGQTRSVSFSANGATLLSSAEDSSIRLWNVETGKMIYSFTVSNYLGYPQNYPAVFSPSGDVIADGNFKSIDFYDLRDRRQIAVFGNAGANVSSIRYSPDGNQLASGTLDDGLTIWDVQTRRRLYSIKSPAKIYSIAYSSNGKLVVSCASDNLIRIYDVSI